MLVSEPGAPVQDPDFYQSGNTAQFTWVDPAGTIWPGKIDPATGDFVPPSGKAVQVTTGCGLTRNIFFMGQIPLLYEILR